MPIASNPDDNRDEWFWEWARRHLVRFPRHDWPTLDSGYWDTLREVLVRRGVSEAVAEEASILMFEDPPTFPDAFPNALMAKVRRVWRESEVQTSPGPIGDMGSGRFNREADAHWSGLSAEERESCWALVRERLPELAGNMTWLKALSKGWAYDPSLVVGLPPAPETGVKGGPRRIFSRGA